MDSCHLKHGLLLLGLLLVLCADHSSSRKAFTPIKKYLKFGCTPEHLKENGHYYCDSKGRIKCLPGWRDEYNMCNTPICHVNNRTCENGNCSKPYTCDCYIGWTGQFCEKCIRLPGCVNGYCNRSMECICEEGWSGAYCDKAVCEGCVNGECIMPGMCACHPGWSGPFCTECEPRDDCKYGRCIDRPFQCKCQCGYTGPACDIPDCRPCNSTGGICWDPDTCVCRPGWQGEDCSQCIPLHGCQNGDCVYPGECNCRPGFFGKFCQDTDNNGGGWSDWTPWSPCPPCTTSRVVRRRGRTCSNPRPQGTGEYCSYEVAGCGEEEGCPVSKTCPNTEGTLTVILPPQ